MQRTAVIYGLALATLVGAFFLAPRIAKPDPVPPPQPDPIPTVSDQPVTELLYSDGVIEAKARLDRGYLANDGEPLWMDVAIKANGVASRAPLTAVLVVDRSGSMAGDKIEAARSAAERFVNGLQEGDQLAIVTFGTDVTVDLPVTTIDAQSRGRAARVVRAIEEGGGTNIDGALGAANRVLSSASLAGRVGRIVLVSDGRPTEGDTREATLVGRATNLRGAGLTISTIGVGLDYNEDLMERLAVDGGGRYHYLKTGDQLAKILDDELRQAAAVVASNAKLYLPAQLGGFAFEDAPGQNVSRGQKVAIDVGDLAAGEERHVLLKLKPSQLEGANTFAAPEVVYRRPADQSDALLSHRADPFRVIATADRALVDGSRRDDVRVRVLQVEASLALTASMQSYAQGDAASARKQLAQKKAELESVAARTKDANLAAEAKNFDDVLGGLAAPAASAAGQDMVKAQKARAFTLRR